jgi:hypothetical protein
MLTYLLQRPTTTSMHTTKRVKKPVDGPKALFSDWTGNRKDHIYPQRGGCKFGIIPARSRSPARWPAGGRGGAGLGGWTGGPASTAGQNGGGWGGVTC